MKENNKVYWKGIEELNNEPEFVKNAESEFPAYLPVSGDEDSAPDRRDFLKLLGFSVAAVSLAACEAPVKKAIPYLNKPEEVEPGIPNYYASTYLDGGEYCSILVKTREGRPIKIEGNRESSISNGGTGSRVQASVLSLYDSFRLNGFRANGKAAEQKDVDAAVIKQLDNISSQGGAIRIVSQTILSPSTKKAIAEFKAKYPTTEHVVYDVASAYGLTKANEIHFGQSFVPTYDFSKAEVIVSFGADFLGTWISPVEYTKQFAKTRKLSKTKKTMSRLYQFETNLSLTGSNADHRFPIKPSQEGLFVAELYKRITGNSSFGTDDIKNDILDKVVADLRKAKSSLVVSGSNDVNVQLLVNEINKELGNYGNTIDLTPSYYRQGNDEQMNAFVSDLKEGKVAGVIFYNANPAYNHPLAADVVAGLKKTALSVSFADRADETASLCQYIAPDHHYLEAWNDAEPRKGFYSLGQPTIAPVFKTRAAQESLLIWAGNTTSYYDYIRNNWSANILNGASWDKTLEMGVFEPGISRVVEAPVASDSTAAPVAEVQINSSVSLNATPSDVAENINKTYKKNASGLELKVYQKIGIGTGSQANNPWLQELPDPISKATWGNYVAVSQRYAKEVLKVEQNAVVKVTVNGKDFGKLPVLIQPGQAYETISIAVGYGRAIAGRTAEQAGGINIYGARTLSNGSWSSSAVNVKLEATGETDKIAQTQTHHTIMNRPIIQDATLDEYIKHADAGRYYPIVNTPDGKKTKPADVDLWKKDHPKVGHLWGMSIDLNSCMGCGTCVIACQAENNVPIVGKREVINRREMHWIRIDRYYSAEVDEKNPVGSYFAGGYNPNEFEAMEHPTENPQVTFQPMMCQQCNHAPCETVCPVAATTHSSEGLNQMTYNRCVGTRYCANNCPFKVRRFNWFKYFDNKEFSDINTAGNDPLGRTVLNPDVTVRSRGVMEKCSFCVQKIQAGKLKAKMERRKLEDGDIETACSAACATGAIKFGDQNDVNSLVYKETNDYNKERSYTLLEELNVQPNIYYLTKIRNVNA